MTVPNKSAANGRTAGGRFAKGNPGGPGRPRGFDFRKIVEDHVEATGSSVEDTILAVFLSLFRQAREGDVSAAKFLIERLCGKDPLAVDIKQEIDGHALSDVERTARIEAILDGARRRAEAERSRSTT